MPIKPVVGVIDFVTVTAEGIRNTTTITDKEITRSRPPRVVTKDKIIKVKKNKRLQFDYSRCFIQEYEETEAEGNYLLHSLNESSYASDEYIFHTEVDRHIFLLSNKRIVMIDKEDTTEFWTVPLIGKQFSYHQCVVKELNSCVFTFSHNFSKVGFRWNYCQDEN